MSATGATLSATFSGIPTDPAPQAAFFRYGTNSSSLSGEAYDNDVVINTSDGSFSADIASLNPGTTYYYQAVITLGDGSDVVGAVRSFTTTSGSSNIERHYLDNYEMPAVSVLTFSAGTEKPASDYGGTPCYSYTTDDANQMVVSHTFTYKNSTMHNYTILYDRSKRAALWAAFAMHSTIYPWEEDRYDKWGYDPGIPQDWQPDLSASYNSYQGLAYDRGHQVASNDRRTTIYQTRQTTYFSNMTPQLHDNFNGSVWSTLEGDIQKIGKATTGNDMLYVVTGPIFDSGYKSTTDTNGKSCPIPTRYFKCIMKVTLSNGVPTAATGAAYLLVHENGASRQNTTINAIEQLTGFDFFANVPLELQDAAEAETHPTSYFPQSN